MPEKLKELQDLFLVEAARYNVFPLDDRRYERFNPAIAGRPDLPAGRESMTFYPGMTHLMEMTVLNIKNRSHTITAEVEIPDMSAARRSCRPVLSTFAITSILRATRPVVVAQGHFMSTTRR
jgi:hypothetical protein